MMKRTRFTLTALLAGTTAVFLNCGDVTPVGPRARTVAPQADWVGALSQGFRHSGLLRCTPLPYDSVTQNIGPMGGVIRVGPHSLTIPAGALSEPLTITAVAPSDTINRVQFQPEGLIFNTSASLILSATNCGALDARTTTRIAYTDRSLKILYYLQSDDNESDDDQPDDIRSDDKRSPGNKGKTKSKGKLNHFSEYALAW